MSIPSSDFQENFRVKSKTGSKPQCQVVAGSENHKTTTPWLFNGTNNHTKFWLHGSNALHCVISITGHNVAVF